MARSVRGGAAGGVGIGFLACAVFAGCSDEAASPAAAPRSESSPAPTATPPTAPPPPDSRSPEELIAAGRGTYNGNCIACHAMDPKVDGALGPAVAGASIELLEARVLRAEYPAGYVPKRATRAMIPMPHLEAKLPELAAYLGSLE